MPRKRDQKRIELIEAAAKLFAAKPYHEVRIDDVAAAAQVSKGTVYTYFSSKEDLYLSLLTEGARHVVTRIEGIAANEATPPMAALDAMIEEVAVFALGNPDVFRLQHAGALNITSSELTSFHLRARAAVTTVIRRGVASGEFTDPDPSLTYFIITGFAAEVMKFETRPPSLEMIVNQLRTVMLRGLLSRPEAGDAHGG